MVFVAGHFGEWLQGLVGPAGRVALVTLACPRFGVRGAILADAPFGLTQTPETIGPATVGRFLSALDRPARGAVRLTADLPPGGGAGMSTAALVALGRLLGAAEAGLPAACLAAEGAVDPLMLPRPDRTLWAPREARALAPLPPPPAAEVAGGFLGPPLRTDPCDVRFPPVDDLAEAWAAGPDLAEAARLSSLAAARTTALRGPAGDPTPDLARALGALGWARAHTGSARALIFAPGAVPPAAEAALRDAGLAHVVRFRTGGRG